MSVSGICRKIMTVAVDEAQFIGMLVKLMKANKTMEVGVFTGYSLLATALALPPHAQIIAIDPDKEAFEFGLPYIKKAGVDHKITFIQSDGMSALNNLVTGGNEEGTYDFIFVDADKDNYRKYHEYLVRLVKVGGVIAYDNTLWFGSVALPDESLMPAMLTKYRGTMIQMNAFLAADARVESTLLSIGDGLTLCRRLYCKKTSQLIWTRPLNHSS